jgi:hypothetical protein
MKTWTQIQKQEHGSQLWLDQRFTNENGEKQISASVAAAIYGEHYFTSPAALAAELLRDTPPTPSPTNEAMERGNRMEDMLLNWANDKLGANFVCPDKLFVFSDGNARMIATLDGFDGERIGEASHPGPALSELHFDSMRQEQLVRSWELRGLGCVIAGLRRQIAALQSQLESDQLGWYLHMQACKCRVCVLQIESAMLCEQLCGHGQLREAECGV